MNPERWAEITTSFAFNQNHSSAETGNRKLTGRKDDYSIVIQSAKSEKSCNWDSNALHEPSLSYRKCGANFQNSGLTKSEKLESRAHCGHNYLDPDDLQGKLIENLYKILKEKSEKVKIQEQVIQALNDKLQTSSKDTFVQTGISKSYKEDKEIAASNEENYKEMKVYDPSNDTHEGTLMLKEIGAKVDNLENRLDYTINCFQRRFPKAFFQDGKERQVPSKPWDKSPIVYPRPTQGSMMREIHCRRRYNNGRDITETVENKFSRRNIGIIHQQRGISAMPSVPVMQYEEDMEQRLQALESLVVLLKRKIMTRIISKSKQKKI